MNIFIDKDIPNDCKLLPAPPKMTSPTASTPHAWDSLISITLDSIIAKIIVKLKPFFDALIVP